MDNNFRNVFLKKYCCENLCGALTTEVCILFFSGVYNIVDFYSLSVKLSSPRKFMIASDGIGSSSQLLNVLDSSRDLKKLGIATLSSFSSNIDNAEILTYISQRLALEQANNTFTVNF